MTKIRKIPVEYIGNKPFTSDNVAGSGAIWRGRGDIQYVTEKEALVLSKYRDQWRMVEEKELDESEEKENSESNNDLTNDDNVVDEKKKPIERWSKPELLNYAKECFDVDLSSSLSRKQLIDEVSILIAAAE